jgi:hypothetical protein
MVICDFLFRVAGTATSDIRVLAVLHARFIRRSGCVPRARRARCMDRGRNEDSLAHLSCGAAFAQPCGSAPSVLKPEAMVFGPASWAELYVSSSG